ncbi:MAG: HEAT repeat domain-containing protein [Candidatus Obscuribacterales bacterium]|nr:HEAT repeat domain-containing protein [Candidatus Obscuribacterales bacterium]
MPSSTGDRGVFCMPVLPNFYASHQWLRELRRGGRTALVAIDFRLPKDEIVLVGHFSEPHLQVTIAEAAGIIMKAEDPMGYEILLPRSVARQEIHKVRSVSQVIGWRYYPKAKGNKPSCTCDFCIRGQYGANKLRERLGTADSKPLSKQQAMEILRNGDDPDAMRDVLYNFLGSKQRKNPEELEFLLDHPSSEVQRGLAFALRFYRGKKAAAMLSQLSQHEDEQVRSEAEESLVQNRTDLGG